MHTAQVGEEEILTAIAYALSHLASHPGEIFFGPCCRPTWCLDAPEIRLGTTEKHGDTRLVVYSVATSLLAVVDPHFANFFAKTNDTEKLQWMLNDGPAQAWLSMVMISMSLREFLAKCCARSRRDRPPPSEWAKQLRLLWNAEARFSFPSFPYTQRDLWQVMLQATWVQLGLWRWWIIVIALGTIGFLLFFY